MTRLTAPGALLAALIGSASPAPAATAHNSQAGSWGSTSHACAPTPYFPTGGCASASIVDDERFPLTVGAEAPRRPSRRFTSPLGPLPAPSYGDD